MGWTAPFDARDLLEALHPGTFVERVGARKRRWHRGDGVCVIIAP
jgi:hypothetical protein